SLSLAVSILFSGFLALSMTPALCVTLLKPIPKGHHADKKGFFGWFNRRFTGLTNGYQRTTGGLVMRSGSFMLVYVAIVAALAFSYLRLPEAFLPTEDQGYMIVDVQMPPGATTPRTEKAVETMEEHFLSRPSVASVISVMGFSFSGMGQNAALAFPTLVDWSERGSDEAAQAETQRANESLAGIQDGTILALEPPSIDR